jgi:hypothetical protein
MALTSRVERIEPVTADEWRASKKARMGVESNTRLTASVAAVLLALLFAEGVTIVRIRTFLPVHVFLGMLLVPPVLLKIGSTTYRFARYYSGSRAYRRKGPPSPLLRILGPFVAVSTVAVVASGIALLLVGRGLRQDMLFAHKATFVLWFVVMTVHVLGHLRETARFAPRDWARKTRASVEHAKARQWAVVSSVVLGVPLGMLLISRVGPWLSAPLSGH